MPNSSPSCLRLDPHLLASLRHTASRLKRQLRHTPQPLNCLLPDLTTLSERLSESQELYSTIGYRTLAASSEAAGLSSALEHISNALNGVENLLRQYEQLLETMEEGQVPKEWNALLVGRLGREVRCQAEWLGEVFGKLEMRFVPPNVRPAVRRIVGNAMGMHGRTGTVGDDVGLEGYEMKVVWEEIREWCRERGVSNEYVDEHMEELEGYILEAVAHYKRSKNSCSEDVTPEEEVLTPTSTRDSQSETSKSRLRWKSGNLLTRLKWKSRQSVTARVRTPAEARKELESAIKSCSPEEKYGLLTQYLQLHASMGDLDVDDEELLNLLEWK
ncbi:hypothetical protein BJ508DRAFT_417738 [Ascobolus immersus RN42]|uniref:Uncharacterized protein n=1 Tax=Ascobolus immersus RN42 TaxID=1160509 RepID=A0A3N4HS17_ASCIM|nr:hypothetical protein BJ508DRAFT_417738 [Ascobolus immersus RN42]